MRIAYICADPGVPVFGRKGCSLHVQEVVHALRAQGERVEVFATSFDGQPLHEIERQCLHRLPSLPAGEAREQAAITANRELTAALKREGPFDLIYERYSLWSFAGMEYAQAISVPGLLEVNAPLIEEQAKHRRLADRGTAECLAGRIFGAATSLIAVSDEVAAYLKRYPNAGGRVHVVPNAVDPARFPANIKPTFPSPGTFTVGFVGTLKPWHGLTNLVEAFDMLQCRYQDTRLLIVGDGPEREKLEEVLSARGLLEASKFTGAVAPKDVPGLLASMDTAIAPYPNQSNFYFSPLKVYEYMAAGLPVVASRVGQLMKLIQNGVNGFLYTPDDITALVKTLETLRQDCELRIRIGKAARATVIRHHTWDGVARHILNLADNAKLAQVLLPEMKCCVGGNG